MKQAKDLARKIAPIYKLLKWEWRDEGIPDEIDIYDTIRMLLSNLKKDVDCSSTGGIFVERKKDEFGEKFINISFRIDEDIYDTTH